MTAHHQGSIGRPWSPSSVHRLRLPILVLVHLFVRVRAPTPFLRSSLCEQGSAAKTSLRSFASFARNLRPNPGGDHESGTRSRTCTRTKDWRRERLRRGSGEGGPMGDNEIELMDTNPSRGDWPTTQDAMVLYVERRRYAAPLGPALTARCPRLVLFSSAGGQRGTAMDGSAPKGREPYVICGFFPILPEVRPWRTVQMVKLPWTKVTVHLAARAALVGVDRLAVLLRWLFGSAPPEALFSDSQTGRMLSGTELVHWDGFPLQEAMTAAQEKDTQSSGVRLRSPSPQSPEAEDQPPELAPITRRVTPPPRSRDRATPRPSGCCTGRTCACEPMARPAAW